MTKPSLILLIVGMLSGCADPLTKTLKDNHFAPIVPIPEIQNVGDIYRTTDLGTPPVLLMRDIFPKEKNDEFMKSLKGRVQLPSTSSDSTFDLTLEADVIGYAQTELNAHNVKKFRLKIGGANQYLISEDKFENELFPLIKLQRPTRDFNGNYVVLALLQATTLEYELLDESGGKIAVQPGSKVEEIVKAKLGAEWKANENQNLTIDTPSFVGYRIGKITSTGFDPGSVRPLIMMFSKLSSGEGNSLLKPIMIEDVPVEQLRDSIKAKAKNPR